MQTSMKTRVAAYVAVLLGFTATGLVQAAAPPQPAKGLWQEHRYSFVFMGFTSTYSCDGLADKLKLLLIAAGARADAEARSGGCASGYGRPDKFARADLIFNTLTPAADGTPPGATDATAEGIWRTVAFAAHRPRELRTGDCELVDQFTTGVLPMFATRGLQNKTSCIPHQESGSNINLKFDVFAAATPAAPNKRQK